MKLGILGGTFDPPHCGHLLMAHAALSALGLDRVVFMPAGDPYFKSGSRTVSLAVHRLAMTRLAVKGEPRFRVSGMETERSGQTYTSDTLRELHARHPDDELYFILGADTLMQLRLWHEPETIFALAGLAVLARDEQVARRDLTAECDRLREEFGARIHLVPWEGFETSSTEIRDRAAADDPEAEAPGSVVRYIRRTGLYAAHPSVAQIKARIRKELSRHRYLHSLGVAETACDLACIYGEDPDRAYLTGLLHDIGKPYAGALEHGHLGAVLAERYYGVTDPLVLAAIAHHTVGAEDMSLLEEIIYVADMVEPGRDPFPGLEDLRLAAYSDIKKAVALCSRSVISHLKERGVSIDGTTLKVYNKYRSFID